MLSQTKQIQNTAEAIARETIEAEERRSGLGNSKSKVPKACSLGVTRIFFLEEDSPSCGVCFASLLTQAIALPQKMETDT